ncbi:trans-aconitate 2-methyltransferase [Thermomonospora echinospora]|uniref:Trans-aconitate 2-methyltransferase n=1 Tax=Thermomonospora echinospora TaxID=1992 RepID=A0A1H6AGG8_9ACTN|nr:trans-aconitate 2-methyltransferase [Thermomonospora echinospora]SEG47167.1 trans-aconitate 2-methyltransferase [Thermomonospora echinospora]
MSRETVAAGRGPVWDPAQYAVFGAERGRAFAELVGRIPLRDPAHVVDLGCGSGELTMLLADRWPGARIDALDGSPEMIARATASGTAGREAVIGLPAREDAADAPGRESAAGGQEPTTAGSGAAAERVRFAVGDVRTWRPGRPVDVIVSNAVLQWVPEHEELLVRWAGDLAPGGCLAFQVPGNYEAPSHMLLREVCRSARWRDRLADALHWRPVRDAAGYLELLAGLGCAVDAWETTYVQVLQGEDAVLEWVKGTALRPVLSALDERKAEEFLAEYGARLREAYPPRPYGTVFPFRRIFVVARRPEAGVGPPP